MSKNNDLEKHLNNILKKMNILYIEDEENIRANMKKTLSILCDNIYDTYCINEAYKLYENHRIDIIISDINLPEQSGIDFVKDLRKSDKTIPVILLSAYTDKHYLLEATKLKLVDYLTKPVDFKTLLSTLQKCVNEILDNSRYILNFGNDVLFNVLQKRLYEKNEKEILLTSKELLLLDFLIKNSNKVVSAEEIKLNIWEDSDEATDSALKNLLTKLRKKIGKDSLENISGVGYRLVYN